MSELHGGAADELVSVSVYLCVVFLSLYLSLSVGLSVCLRAHTTVAHMTVAHNSGTHDSGTDCVLVPLGSRALPSQCQCIPLSASALSLFLILESEGVLVCVWVGTMVLLRQCHGLK